MRRRILASLGDQPARDPNEWVYTLSGVLGAVAGVVTRAGRAFSRGWKRSSRRRGRRASRAPRIDRVCLRRRASRGSGASQLATLGRFEMQ